MEDIDDDDADEGGSDSGTDQVKVKNKYRLYSKI